MREKLYKRRISKTYALSERVGKDYTLTVSWYSDGRIGEIFIDGGRKEGTFIKDITHAFAIIFSIALQYGIPLEELCHSLKGLEMEPPLLQEILEILENDPSNS